MSTIRDICALVLGALAIVVIPIVFVALFFACLGGAFGVLVGSARLAYEWVTR